MRKLASMVQQASRFVQSEGCVGDPPLDQRMQIFAHDQSRKRAQQHRVFRGLLRFGIQGPCQHHTRLQQRNALHQRCSLTELRQVNPSATQQGLHHRRAR